MQKSNYYLYRLQDLTIGFRSYRAKSLFFVYNIRKNREKQGKKHGRIFGQISNIISQNIYSANSYQHFQQLFPHSIFDELSKVSGFFIQKCQKRK